MDIPFRDFLNEVLDAMSVNVNFLNFGVPTPATFVDSFATAPVNPRNALSPPSDNWLYLIIGGDSPYSQPVVMPSFGFGQALSGAGGTGMIITAIPFAANPNYSLAAAIAPVTLFPITSRYYKALQKFVQVTFNSNTSAQAGPGIMNFEDVSGTGIGGNNNINHDCYLLDIAAAHYRVQRFNSVANPAQIISTGTPTQGDVLRLGFDFTVSTQCTVTLSVNGTVAATAIDNAANHLTGPAFPIMGCYSMTAATDSEWKNWSCGLGL